MNILQTITRISVLLFSASHFCNCQVLYNNFANDQEKNGDVAVGSNITFTVTAQQDFSVTTHTWKYNTSDIATVQNDIDTKVNTTKLLERAYISAERDSTSDKILHMTLMLSDLHINDDGQQISVGFGSIGRSVALSVKACIFDSLISVNANLPEEECGVGCTANFTCPELFKGSPVLDVECQRNATWSKPFPHCEQVTCNSSSIKDTCGCVVDQNVTANAFVALVFKSCELGGYAECDSSGAWVTHCNTNVCNVPSGGIDCVTDCGEKCTLGGVNETYVPYGEVVLNCPAGCDGQGTAICTKDGFEDITMSCETLPCTSNMLECGVGKECKILTPNPVFGDAVVASCPEKYDGEVSATCSSDDTFTNVNAFCERSVSRNVTNEEIVIIVVVIFLVAGGSGSGAGYFLRKKQLEATKKKKKNLTNGQLAGVIIGCLVIGFAAGYFIGSKVAEMCNKDSSDDEEGTVRMQAH